MSFQEFAHIREIAERHEAAGRGLGPIRLELEVAISALTEERSLELMKIVCFGRDYLPKEGENGVNEFVKYEAGTWLDSPAGRPGYLADKPLARYLNQAEQKLRGEWPKERIERSNN